MYMRAIVGALEHDDEEHNHRQSHLADVMDFGGFLRLNDVTNFNDFNLSDRPFLPAGPLTTDRPFISSAGPSKKAKAFGQSPSQGKRADTTPPIDTTTQSTREQSCPPRV